MTWWFESRYFWGSFSNDLSQPKEQSTICEQYYKAPEGTQTPRGVDNWVDSLRADRGDNREAFDACPRPRRVHNHYGPRSGWRLRGRFPLQARDRDRGVVLRVRLHKFRDSGRGSRGSPGRLPPHPKELSPRVERGVQPLEGICSSVDSLDEDEQDRLALLEWEI